MKPLPGEGLPGADPFTAIRDQISGRAYSNQEFLAFRYQGMDPGDAVQDLVTHFNLDPALAETYGSNYADVFATGLPATDNVAKTRLDGGRKKVIVKIADDFGALMTHKPLEDSTIARAAEDKDIQLSLAARQGGKQLEAFLSKSTGKSWLRDKQAIKDAGFFRSAMFSAAWSAIALDYYPESELPESAVPVESIPEGDINYLYAGEPVPGTLSMEAITEQRRKHNQVDLSQERLDERL
ncbi:MAG TPA: hypothetical protein VLA92_00980, partial [Candidatus Saccharimonadales bacterium]|nr:hypothetical protein [Candidatus Saccharimonadales bacterium]